MLAVSRHVQHSPSPRLGRPPRPASPVASTSSPSALAGGRSACCRVLLRVALSPGLLRGGREGPAHAARTYEFHGSRTVAQVLERVVPPSVGVGTRAVVRRTGEAMDPRRTVGSYWPLAADAGRTHRVDIVAAEPQSADGEGLRSRSLCPLARSPIPPPPASLAPPSPPVPPRRAAGGPVDIPPPPLPPQDVDIPPPQDSEKRNDDSADDCDEGPSIDIPPPPLPAASDVVVDIPPPPLPSWAEEAIRGGKGPHESPSVDIPPPPLPRMSDIAADIPPPPLPSTSAVVDIPPPPLPDDEAEEAVAEGMVGKGPNEGLPVDIPPPPLPSTGDDDDDIPPPPLPDELEEAVADKDPYERLPIDRPPPHSWVGGGDISPPPLPDEAEGATDGVWPPNIDALPPTPTPPPPQDSDSNDIPPPATPLPPASPVVAVDGDCEADVPPPAVPPPPLTPAPPPPLSLLPAEEEDPPLPPTPSECSAEALEEPPLPPLPAKPPTPVSRLPLAQRRRGRPAWLVASSPAAMSLGAHSSPGSPALCVAQQRVMSPAHGSPKLGPWSDMAAAGSAGSSAGSSGTVDSIEDVMGPPVPPALVPMDKRIGPDGRLEAVCVRPPARPGGGKSPELVPVLLWSLDGDDETLRGARAEAVSLSASAQVAVQVYEPTKPVSPQSRVADLRTAFVHLAVSEGIPAQNIILFGRGAAALATLRFLLAIYKGRDLR
eukprot:m51a1_g2213 hypothetical protein (715) ;mRNA; f:204818-206962